MCKNDNNKPKFEKIKTLGYDYINSIRNICPNTSDRLLEQDNQIILINKAEEDFYNDGNITKIIQFWENIFQNGGLTFRSVKWNFRLVDLYCQNGDYNKALSFLENLKGYEKEYNEYYNRIISKIGGTDK